MSDETTVERRTLRARAHLLGQRIDVAALAKGPTLATAPLVLSVEGGGCAVVFRYGAVVQFGLGPEREAAFIDSLRPLVKHPLETPETEAVSIALAPDRTEGLEADESITLRDAATERLQTVAGILAKSVALAHFENRMGSIFERVEPLAAHLRTTGRARMQVRDLLKQLGDVMLIQHQMVGRVEVADKPELVWERPDLDRLYTRLQEAYELAERHRALERKLELIGGTTRSIVGLLQDKRTLRVEWYIVILIVVEIVILLYDMFIGRG